MAITRRQFLKRGAASAAALSLGPRFRWLPGTNVSYAAGPSDAIVVFVRLYGGNDGLNTVYPVSDSGGSNQRAKYDEFRPTLGLPKTDAACAARKAAAGFGSPTVLSIGANPDGSTYALHPAMSALHDLYAANKCAVVQGVHYPYADHSHFRSESIYYTVDPIGSGGQGWFGKYLDYAGFLPAAVPGVILNDDIIPIFTPTNTSLFAFGRLSELRFPATGETLPKQAAFNALYAASAGLNPATYPELVSMGNTGVATINNIQLYYKPGSDTGNVEALLVDADGNYDADNPLVYSSPLNPGDNPNVQAMDLARDLKHVAAIIRADFGARFFHVAIGGFDTHSNQENGFFHSSLLREVSESIAAFYAEMNQTVSLPSGYKGQNLANKVLLVTFTEFGRTIRQNAYGANSAGTDHATSIPEFVIGGTVNGATGGNLGAGQYGAYPAFNNPGENKDDLRMTYDARDYFGTVLARWLGVPASKIGPGAGKIFPATPNVDPIDGSYTSFTPIPFLT
jgi:uncharacterized protein (DUF1501 family)